MMSGASARRRDTAWTAHHDGRIQTTHWIHGNGHYGGRALAALASGEAE